MAHDLHVSCVSERMPSTPQWTWRTGPGDPSWMRYSEVIMRNGEIELIRLEVKYCENCGGLWCRRTGDTWIYCATCRSQVLSGDTRNYDRRNQQTRAPGRRRRVQ